MYCLGTADTVGRSHGSNYMTRVYGTKRDDFANGRVGLTSTWRRGAKGLYYWARRFVWTEDYTGALNVTYVDEMLRFHVWKDGVVDECAPVSAGLGKTRIGQRTAAGNWN